MTTSTTRHVTDTTTLALKFQAALREAASELVDRDLAVQLLGCALLSGRNIILFGRRGTGKTILVETVLRRITGSTHYQTALHPAKQLDELFGKLDIPALLNGGDMLKVGRFLDAHTAFLDETPRASDALSEGLFAALEQRATEVNGSIHKLPLWAAIGAANSAFSPDRLGPFRDRFPIGVYVDYVACDAQMRLARQYLQKARQFPTGEPEAPPTTITVAEMELLRAAVPAVQVPESLLMQLLTVVNISREQAIPVSDRRWLQSLDVVKAHALLNGRAIAVGEDIKVVAGATLWDFADDRDTVVGLLEQHVVMNDPVLDELAALAASARPVRDALLQWVADYEPDESSIMNAANHLVELNKQGMAMICAPSHAAKAAAYRQTLHEFAAQGRQALRAFLSKP